ncbi:MAG: hypothetical protein ACPGGG_03050 [Parvibaculales bacterium]
MTESQKLDETLAAFKQLLERAFALVSKPQDYAAAMLDIDGFLETHKELLAQAGNLTAEQKQQMAEIMAGLARLEMQNEARRKWVASLNESLASDGQDTP